MPRRSLPPPRPRPTWRIPARLLVWLDEDTVFLQDPEEFDLPEGIRLGYRPVMHRNIGLRMDEPIDAFWERVYADLSVASGHAAFPWSPRLTTRPSGLFSTPGASWSAPNAGC